MGSYDGADLSEIVGIYTLYQLLVKYNKNNIGLYRDDDLVIFKNIFGPQA